MRRSRRPQVKVDGGAPDGGEHEGVRIAVVTESFLPQVNGVTNSVLRVCEQMQRCGHEVLVIAPGEGPGHWAGARVVRAPAVLLPGYADFRLSRPWAGLVPTLRAFGPDVVHLASPAVLGAQAAFAAQRLGVPVVAVYQTDLAGFASRYRLRPAENAVWSWLRRVHGMAETNLAPSQQAIDDLHRNGVQRVKRWARGVDLDLFAPGRRDPQLRAQLAPDGEVIVGYVGRLAQEKQIELLAGLDRRPGMRLVIIGDGPRRHQLEHVLPNATFLGFRTGVDLAAGFASLDVFVHPGAHETFCQAAQEALASGVPVVGPSAGGLLDLIDPGVTGHLFTPGSAAALRTRVESLVADPALRARMALAARDSVAGRSWDVLGDELVAHYRAAVAA